LAENVCGDVVGQAADNHSDSERKIVNISQIQALSYEIRASWWANRVSNPFLQDLAGRYFAWKVRRKFGRYQQMIEAGKRLADLKQSCHVE
jgi:hypothetical protein